MEGYEIKVVKTTDFTEAQELQVLNLFNEVFKQERTLSMFENQYKNNPFGASFHTVIFDSENNIVGHTANMPSYFKIDGEVRKVVCNTDTMIQKKHRDIDLFMELITENMSFLKSNGFSFVYGFPNDMSYPLLTKLKFLPEIGSMYTYCLPYRIGGIKSSLKWLNPISKLLCRCWLELAKMFASKKVHHFFAEKESATYNKTRYQRYDQDYKVVTEKDNTFMYKVMKHEGIRVAFLVDVVEKSEKNFVNAVKYIIKNSSKDFDLILYPGLLPFGCTGLIKIPHKYEPKHFHYCGKSLDGKNKKELKDIASWDINLSNYDLL